MIAKIFTVLLFVAAISAYTNLDNNAIPAYTNKNEHRYKASITAIGAPGLNPVYRSTGCRRTDGTSLAPIQCVANGQVNPSFKYYNTYVQTFTPMAGQVLISFDADDDGIATTTTAGAAAGPGGATIQEGSASTLFTGIVVAAGSGVPSTIVEGTRVYVDPACASQWTTASWNAKYGPEKAIYMNNKYVNGVDLNNADGWSLYYNIYNPSYYYGGSGQTSAPLTNGVNGGTMTNGVLNGANAGMSSTSTQTLNDGAGDMAYANLPAGADAMTPTENPNQQSNYLLCPIGTGGILGIVNQNSFPNIDAGHYEQPNTVLRGLRNPSAYMKSSI